MATLTTDKMEYVILDYHEYKRIWSPEINESLATVEKLEFYTSRMQNLS